MVDSNVVVFDNGGGLCKVGFAGERQPRRVFPNCTGKPKGERQSFVGDMLLDCRDISSLKLWRPVDRGFLVNWDLEKEVWSRAFKSVLKINPREHSLLMTEPLFNFPQIQSSTEQVIFEEFGFQAYYAQPAPWFSLRRAAQLQPELPASQALTGVVVDAGFSFTHAVPFFNGQVLLEGVRRINLGGKALTNYLKELVTYRHLHMMDETYLVEHIKEALCFVSQDVRVDLAVSQRVKDSPHRREYVLPDGVHNLRGYIRDAAVEAAQQAGSEGPSQRAPAPEQQVLVLNNERFMVPETMFHPRDIGLNQAGVPETIVLAVSATRPALHPLLYSNVILTGGTVLCPGFHERVVKELRPLVPNDCELHVLRPPDPMLAAWEGASAFGASPEYRAVAMTKAEYEEHGGAQRMA